MTVELEWACRVAAVRGALAAGLRSPHALFVNVEPSMIAAPRPDEDDAAVVDAGLAHLDVVVELTERALTDRPADVIAGVERLRGLGAAFALDDIGADRRSLALMPFVRPCVMKLDLRLVQERPSRDMAAIVHAVNAEAERSGAVIVAEGIETAEQRETARALGARYGQGWLFGRPGPLGVPGAADFDPWVRSRPPVALDGKTPFEVVARHQAPRRGSKRLLLEMSLQLEAQAAAESAVLLATFQDAEHFTPITRTRYERIAEHAAFVGALGVGMGSEPMRGVRGVELDAAEPLRGEWNVVVLDPHFSAAFVAHDLGDTGGDDMQRRFDFCLTYDRDLVVAAARAMMARVAPRG